jgi:hypothetical protein
LVIIVYRYDDRANGREVMQTVRANIHPMSDRRAWAASVVCAAGWGCGWFVSLIVLMSSYFERALDFQGALKFNLIFGVIGITTTLAGLWMVRVRLPLIRVILLFAMWAIISVGVIYSDFSKVNGIIGVMLVQILVFAITFRWILLRSVEGVAQQDRGNLALGWIVGLGLPLIICSFTTDLAYWLFLTPLLILLTGSFGSAVTFWRIQRAQSAMLATVYDEPVEPILLGQLMESSAQRVTFEVVHDSGKPKAKRKPKPVWWSSIPHLRLYIAVLALAVVLTIGISLLIIPVREVRVPGFITPNPTNSTPGSQWGNRLPPTNPRWGWNVYVLTNSPAGDIPANEAVYLKERYYDFGADMWWYKATSLTGKQGDAWEWQINPVAIFDLTITAVTLVPASEWTATFSPTMTPFSDKITSDNSG